MYTIHAIETIFTVVCVFSWNVDGPRPEAVERTVDCTMDPRVGLGHVQGSYFLVR